MKLLYRTAAQSTGKGREGHVRSSDGLLDLDLAMPKELGGTGDATNPEQLFAAGYAACFHSTLKLLADERKLDIGGSTVTADVGIGARAEGGYGLVVALRVELSGVGQDVADEMAAQAHQTCPYSNATRGNCDVTITTTTL